MVHSHRFRRRQYGGASKHQKSFSDRTLRIAVFGFAHFAEAFHQLLARVGRDCDVTVYSLSPCEGFWEDADRTDPHAALALGSSRS